MERLYECDINKKKDLIKILDADPYASDSFARIGYIMREGSILNENRDKVYIYVKSDNSFIKKADERLKDVASVLTSEDEKRIITKILSEVESAQAGFGSMFSE